MQVFVVYRESQDYDDYDTHPLGVFATKELAEAWIASYKHPEELAILEFELVTG